MKGPGLLRRGGESIRGHARVGAPAARPLRYREGRCMLEAPLTGFSTSHFVALAPVSFGVALGLWSHGRPSQPWALCVWRCVCLLWTAALPTSGQRCSDLPWGKARPAWLQCRLAAALTASCGSCAGAAGAVLRMGERLSGDRTPCRGAYQRAVASAPSVARLGLRVQC